MSEEKPSKENVSNNTLRDECIFLSTVYDDYADYFPSDKADRSDSQSSPGNVFFLAICVTFLVIISASRTQTAVIYDEVERVTRDAVSEISNFYNFKWDVWRGWVWEG